MLFGGALAQTAQLGIVGRAMRLSGGGSDPGALGDNDPARVDPAYRELGRGMKNPPGRALDLHRIGFGQQQEATIILALAR